MKDEILFPKSIAVVGVSNDKSKIGRVIYDNAVNGGYQGKIYPVNPKYDNIDGKQCFPTVNDINGDVDMVCIVLPYQLVEDVVDDCIL